MKKNLNYVAPEAELRATRIRCSILAGSNGQTQEVKPSGPAGGGTPNADDIGDDPNFPGNGARKRTLSF
jgi:hypothetical protein